MGQHLLFNLIEIPTRTRTKISPLPGFTDIPLYNLTKMAAGNSIARATILTEQAAPSGATCAIGCDIAQPNEPNSAHFTRPRSLRPHFSCTFTSY